jgi:hypothetical protein
VPIWATERHVIDIRSKSNTSLVIRGMVCVAQTAMPVTGRLRRVKDKSGVAPPFTACAGHLFSR